MKRSHRQLIAIVSVAAVGFGLFIALNQPDDSSARGVRPAERLDSRSAAVTVPSAPSSADRVASPTTTVSASPPAPSKETLWQTEWRRWLMQTSTPERDAGLAEALKQLSATEPEAAAEYFLTLHPTDRVAVAGITLAEAASRTADEAVREAIRFCDEDPGYALEYGRLLISTLGKNGDYRAALGFVLAEESNGWLGENGHKWLTDLFTTWGKAAPEQAAEAAQQTVGPGLRGEALQTLAAAWVKVDPSAAANFAWQLPVSSEREWILDRTLQLWSEADPAATTAWSKAKGIGPR